MQGSSVVIDYKKPTVDTFTRAHTISLFTKDVFRFFPELSKDPQVFDDNITLLFLKNVSALFCVYNIAAFRFTKRDHTFIILINENSSSD